MTDSDPMPFGKHRGEQMERVPSSYLLWLRDQNCSHKEVRAYIEENLTILLDDCPDHVDSPRNRQ